MIPVYNERDSIGQVLHRVREIPCHTQVIVVDDGSTDGTRSLLDEFESRGLIDELIFQNRNRGKGAALRRGFASATGHIVAVQDADLEYDPKELPRLMEPILSGKADAVYGSRFLGGPHRVLLFWHMVGNRFLTTLSNMLTDLNLTDMETCYKVMRRDLLSSLSLSANRFGIEPQLTARLAQARARIYELPISYDGRTYEDGKKIRWTDGVAAIWFIVRSALPPRARPWLRPTTLPWAEDHPAGPDQQPLEATGDDREGRRITGAA